MKVLLIQCSALSKSALLFFFKGSQAFLTCPPDQSSIKMKMNVRHWWKNTAWGRTKSSEKNLSQCHVVCPKWNYNSRQKAGSSSYHPRDLFLWFQCGYLNS